MRQYDTEDYFNVDPHLGGNQALIRLRQATRQRGMRLILDGVFNHSGDSCAWFDRYRTGDGSGAARSEESPYRNWYTFGPQGALGWKAMPISPSSTSPSRVLSTPCIVDVRAWYVTGA